MTLDPTSKSEPDDLREIMHLIVQPEIEHDLEIFEYYHDLILQSYISKSELKGLLEELETEMDKCKDCPKDEPPSIHLLKLKEVLGI